MEAPELEAKLDQGGPEQQVNAEEMLSLKTHKNKNLMIPNLQAASATY